MSEVLYSRGYRRRPTRSVRVGRIGIGSDHGLCPQSMTTTRARDVDGSVVQVRALAEAGAALVRITVPQMEDASALSSIAQVLAAGGRDVPLVADVHFNPDVALEAARHVSKVRINPGNYSDTRIAESEEAYADALVSMGGRMASLFSVCRLHGTALRIGVNHGSLSPRVVHRYGAGPQGMVASALEVIEIARSYDFHDLVISLKASDPRVMIIANRLLSQSLDARGWSYPIHLGVTEAGAGEDGRIKSALGIGTLLADGIGDTLRVSLTERPESELPVCREIIAHAARWSSGEYDEGVGALAHYDPFHPVRRDVELFPDLQRVSALLVYVAHDEAALRSALAAEEFGGDPFDFILYDGGRVSALDLQLSASQLGRLAERAGDLGWRVLGSEQWVACLSAREIVEAAGAEDLPLRGALFVVLRDDSLGPWLVRRAVDRLVSLGVRLPIVLAKGSVWGCGASRLPVLCSMEIGPLLVDNLVEGIALSGSVGEESAVRSVGFSLLQASGLRRVRADYIACPGCGRTLFDLQGTLARVQSATQHLRHLRIGVMGCIVNGPGEMADADYGYVGAGVGSVTLYKGQTPVLRGIPESQAIEALVALIRENGDWYEAV